MVHHTAFGPVARPSPAGSWSSRVRRVGAVVLAVALVAACGGGDTTDEVATDATATDATTDGEITDGEITDGEIRGLQTFDGLTRDHVEGEVDYAQDPPVGGDHAPVWQNCGAYADPIADVNGVHSLEHGAVWITYDPDLEDDDVDQLRARAAVSTHVLVSPREDLPSPVVASAWGVQVQLDDATDERLDQFLDAYVQGPQTPEPGVTCAEGTGQPL